MNVRRPGGPAFLAVVGTLGFWSMSAGAAVLCPQQPSPLGPAHFSISNDSATCLGAGNGSSLNGTNDFVNGFGYVTLDIDAAGDSADSPLSITGLGGATGTITFSAIAGYTSYVIGFTDREASPKPDYAAFLLPGPGTYTWEIKNGNGRLDRAVLYGKPAPVPLPAAAWLLLSGLVGFGFIARRRQPE